MSKESPILKVTFQMDFNDFYNFNMHVSKEMIDKSKKKVTIFGAVEIVLAVVFLVLNFTSQANSSLNLVLAVALLCMGLFSVLFYPAFFERQLSKAVKKTFDQNEYFHNDVTEQLHAAADPAHILIMIDGLKITSDDGGMSPDISGWDNVVETDIDMN